MKKGMTWVVCGAGSGVGKTYLVQALCSLLPKSVHAKQGCEEPRADGPENYFQTIEELDAFLDRSSSTYKHIVLESNRLAKSGGGDIVIFVDGVPGKVDIRDDVEMLRARSDIHVSAEAAIREWKKVLRRKIADSPLREKVCDLLAQQKRYLFKGNPGVAVKVWFVDGGMHIFGAGIARLLEHIENCGTLRDAAKAAGMSYRHAWGLLRNAEKHHGESLVILQPGGVGGGQTSLSRHGRHMLTTYNKVCDDIDAVATSCFGAERTE